MRESAPQAQIELDYPEREWQTVWKRLHSGVIVPSASDHLFFIIHERFFTRERAYRLDYYQIDSPSCLFCPNNQVESITHLFCNCLRVLGPWTT